MTAGLQLPGKPFGEETPPRLARAFKQFSKRILKELCGLGFLLTYLLPCLGDGNSTNKSDLLLLKWQNSPWGNFRGRDFTHAATRRNSDGSALYFYEFAKSNIHNIHVFTTNGYVRTVEAESRSEVFLNDAAEMVAWQEKGDYFFRNGAIFHRPTPGWEEIESSVIRTEGGKYFLRDGTVTDFRAFPMHHLSVDPGGQFCIHEIADVAAGYEIGEKGIRQIFTITNLISSKNFGSAIFQQNGDVYVFGNTREPYDKVLRCYVFSPNGTNYFQKKDILFKDVSGIVDMDFSSPRIVAVHPRDLFGDVFYLYDLSTGKKSKIGTGLAKAFFLKKKLKLQFLQKN